MKIVMFNLLLNTVRYFGDGFFHSINCNDAGKTEHIEVYEYDTIQ